MRGRGEGSVRKRIRASGEVYFEARIRFRGRQHSFYARSKTAALAAARQARADAERGMVRCDSRVTVAAWMETWLEQVRPTLRPRSHELYELLARRYIVPVLGPARLVDLTPGHVTMMLARVVAGGRSETTARSVRAVMGSALQAAVADLGLPRNVARLATSPKSARQPFQPETVTPAHARQILTAFEGHALWPLVAFSLATGVRQGELLALRWQDVGTDSVSIAHTTQREGGRWVLARPKTDSSIRLIGLSDLALRALSAARRQGAEARLAAGPAWTDLGLVFPSRTGGVRAPDALRDVWHRRLRSAGLPPLRWHALRRVFAAVLQDAGVPLERVRDLMGHTGTHQTEHYAYTMPGSLRRDVLAVDSLLNEGKMRAATADGASEGPEDPGPAPRPPQGRS